MKPVKSYRNQFYKIFVFVLFCFSCIYAKTAFSLCGDISGDGQILSNDVLMVARASIGILTLTDDQKKRADVYIGSGSPDNQILSNDLLIVARASLGMVTPLCNETGGAVVHSQEVKATEGASLTITDSTNAAKVETVNITIPSGALSADSPVNVSVLSQNTELPSAADSDGITAIAGKTYEMTITNANNTQPITMEIPYTDTSGKTDSTVMVYLTVMDGTGRTYSDFVEAQIDTTKHTATFQIPPTATLLSNSGMKTSERKANILSGGVIIVATAVIVHDSVRFAVITHNECDNYSNFGKLNNSNLRFMLANVGNVPSFTGGSYTCPASKLCVKEIEDKIRDNIVKYDPDIINIIETLPSTECDKFKSNNYYSCYEGYSGEQIQRLLPQNEYNIACVFDKDSKLKYECTGVKIGVGDFVVGGSDGLVKNANGIYYVKTDELDIPPSVGLLHLDCDQGFSISYVPITLNSGEKIYVFNAHPESPNPAHLGQDGCRKAEFGKMFTKANKLKQDGYVVIMGDMNMDPIREEDNTVLGDWSDSANLWNQHVGNVPSKDFNYLSDFYTGLNTTTVGGEWTTTNEYSFDHIISSLKSYNVADKFKVLGKTSGTCRLDGGSGTDHRAIMVDVNPDMFKKCKNDADCKQAGSSGEGGICNNPSTISANCTPVVGSSDNPWITIPAGNFIMGCATGDSQCDNDEFPKHTVNLSAYKIQKYEITNAQYKQCVDAGNCTAPYYSESYTRTSYYDSSTYNNYPVIYVDWNQSKAYCEWIGGRLPTEAEWEKAARGPSPREVIYPWGNNSPTCFLGNFYVGGYCIGDTTAVGNYPSGASYYGVMDMTGNVWEWVNDWYSETYYSSSPSNNPQGPILMSGDVGVLRGGSWNSSAMNIRTSRRDRDYPTDRDYNIGFRCAQN